MKTQRAPGFVSRRVGPVFSPNKASEMGSDLGHKPDELWGPRQPHTLGTGGTRCAGAESGLRAVRSFQSGTSRIWGCFPL